MRLATSGLNVGFLLASFALGMLTGRRQALPVVSGAERALVSGASVSSPLTAAPAARPEPVPSAVAEASRGAKVKSAQPPPSWSRVAASAQSWTAAVRADLNYGAGLIVDRSGFVLTNLHVVAGAGSIVVTGFGGEPSPARVVDSDAELDLALLSASWASPLPTAASLGSALAPAVGDEVLAVGSPRKMYFSVSRGMVSFPNRLFDGVEYIQTDLPINEGNSGGPLVDREGHVVGIVSFILRESQGLSFALPIDRALVRFAAYLSSPPAGAAGDPPARQLPLLSP